MLHIKIHNDSTGTDDAANYTYSVWINNMLLADGVIHGHNRKHGWLELIKMLIEQEDEKASKE